MSLKRINGIGQSVFYPHQIAMVPQLFNATAIAATGDKIAMSGIVWTGASSGTKNISRVGFRFGSSITKAGGSALTVSLQDVSLTAGAPMQPDGTQDQTVAVANGAITANTWLRTGTLSATRTVTTGDLLSMVVEYDGSGRLGSDSITLSVVLGTSASSAYQQCVVSNFASAAWTSTNRNFPNLVLEFDDGTFGTLMGAIPCSSINTHTFKQDTTVADEYALGFQVPYSCKIDGIFMPFNPAANTSDFSVVLYDGTSALATFTVDANSVSTVASPMNAFWALPSEITLSINHQYYISAKPTQTTSNISVYSMDVADANQLVCHPGGINFNFATRLDLGSWAAITTTRRLMAGVHISSLDDGVNTIIVTEDD